MSEKNGEKNPNEIFATFKKNNLYVIKVDLHISGKNKIILIIDKLISKSLRTAIILTI